MNYQNTDLEKEFFRAVEEKNIQKVVELVKEKSVDVNAKDIEHDQNTALHIATEKGYVDTVKILVEDLNADINRDNIGGEYPIHVAGSCYCLNLDLIRYFIQKGSDYSEDVEDVLVDQKFECSFKNNFF